MYDGEKFNTYSHLIGLIISIIACSILITKTAIHSNCISIVSVSIYSATLILMYASSTLYHAIYNTKIKKIFRYFDHVSIYLLIAGSYTPFTLIKFSSGWGWSIFGVIWALAIIGIILELIKIKKIEIISLIIYILMGWLVIIAIKPMISYLSKWELLWLTLGGLFYTIGIYWYINDDKIKHGHGIWHIFVILGSFVQFICIYSLPSNLN